jgi:hypothetical protein
MDAPGQPEPITRVDGDAGRKVRLADPRLERRKCAHCGLVNTAVTDTCRRCGAELTSIAPIQREAAVEALAKTHGVRRRVLWLVGVTWLIVFVWSRSLVFTSDALETNQRYVVARSIALLDSAGFSKEVFVLRQLTNYRATDSWWNVYQGHREAYAATNFPLEIVTLYPAFFGIAVDDTERAAILLHESHHLWGLDEDGALERVWHEKQRLGWTSDQYGNTKVWKNVREWTASSVPALFQCGTDGQSDCVQ